MAESGCQPAVTKLPSRLREESRKLTADHSDEVSCCRRAAVAAAYVVLVVLLAYASGFTALAAFTLQHLGCLPGDGPLLQALFPMGALTFKYEKDGSIDLFHQDYLIMAAPWFMASALWEGFMMFVVLPPCWRPVNVYRINDTIASLSTTLLFILVLQIVLLNWGKMLYETIYTNWRITDALSDIHSPLAFWVAYVMSDFLYYAFHRASHHFSWLWAAHLVHHASEEYNLVTALRQPATEFLTPTALMTTTAMAFILPSELAILQGQLTLLYQFWIHTQLLPPMPTVELVFNTASLHRVHHARNLWALSKNYGAVFSLWDRLFGTFQSEVAEGHEGEQLYYGVIPPLNSWDPLWANVSHWHYMIFVQFKWHGWRTPLVHWTPPNSRCPRLGARLNPLDKFDLQPASGALKAYVVAQFLVAMMATLVACAYSPPHPWSDFQKTAFYGGVLLFVLATVVSVARMGSAQDYQAVKRALAVDAERHLLIVGVAMFAVATLETMQRNLVPYAIGICLYAALHAGCLALVLLACRPRRPEPKSAPPLARAPGAGAAGEEGAAGGV